MTTSEPVAPDLDRAPVVRWSDHALAAAVCLAVTVVATPLRTFVDPANIVMLFLLAVVLVAVKLGRAPAVTAALLGVASFDFFFVPPRFSFAVGDVQYLITFAVMLVVALIIGHLTAGLRSQAQIAAGRETRAHALYGMARDLAGAFALEQVADICQRFATQGLHSSALLLVADAGGELQPVPGQAPGSPRPVAMLARMAFERGEPIGRGTGYYFDDPVVYLPLKGPMRTRGVLAVMPSAEPVSEVMEQRQTLETMASLIAIALERLHFVAVAQDAEIQIESERLRNSLLSAISHDLRTPMTALVGLADSLAMTGHGLTAAQRETAVLIRDQAMRLNSLLHNLLDMARLQVGGVSLRKEWQPVEEVMGASVAAAQAQLDGHRLSVHVEPGLPLLEFDAVLIERVLVNLLENAAKYAPPPADIRIDAVRAGEFVELSVADSGPGLPTENVQSLFGMFVRGRHESSTPGVGLGLAICKTIVEAHGGTMRAANRSEGGARFAFSLLVGSPPAIDEDEMERRVS